MYKNISCFLHTQKKKTCMPFDEAGNNLSKQILNGTVSDFSLCYKKQI